MSDDAARIAALEAEVAYLRAENARLRRPAARGVSPVVVVRLAKRGVRPWLACLWIGVAAWIGYAVR